MSENLSKVLFSHKFNVQETSTIIANSSNKKNHIANDVIMEGEQQDAWYRLLKFMLWSWQGLDIIDCYEVLAYISSSTNERSDEHILDSVTGFRPGNWNYEWTQKAMEYQKQANQFAKAEDHENAQKAYYKASQFYSVASYPHLRNDELAMQSQALAFTNYRESFKYRKKYLLKEVKIHFQGKDVTCYLHLPDDETIHPVVIVSGGLDMLQCELLPLFEKDLAPAGIAMLTVDLPGIGCSTHIKLAQDSSNLHQAIIAQLKDVAWVDHDRVAVMGMRFGGNIATRLAFLEPKSVVAVVAVGAAVASIFDHLDSFKKLPPMLLDCIASRMQIYNSDAQTLYQHCVPLSLVTQGLLGRKRIKTPLLSIGHKDDIMCHEQDLRLISRISYDGELYIIDKPPIFEAYLKALSHSSEWLARHLAE